MSITDQITTQIVSLYHAGLTIKAITGKIGVSDRTIFRVIKRDVDPSYSRRKLVRIAPSTEAAIAASYAAGKSIRNICRDFHASRMRVYSIIDKNGLARRKISVKYDC